MPDVFSKRMGSLDITAQNVAHREFLMLSGDDFNEDWMYEKFAEKYAFDPETQEWMKDVNPWALHRTEVLLEAEQRGLWNAKPEIKQELQKLYMDIEGELEGRSDD